MVNENSQDKVNSVEKLEDMQPQDSVSSAESSQDQSCVASQPQNSARNQAPVMPTVSVSPSVSTASAKKSNAPTIVAIMLLALLIIVAIGSCVSRSSEGSMGLGVGSDKVAIITLSGTIQYDGTSCSPEGFKYLLDEAENDSSIKAVVLRVDSGGGTATAGEEMTEYLKDFSKPVVVSSASINASAAYEISSQSDYIYVARSTEIGSIGTAMQLMNYGDLLRMLGINVEVIASADSKDSSYGYRDLTAEEREHYQQMINEINEMFIENVAFGRGKDIEEIRELATGMAWAGETAIELGLADEIGTLDDACDKAAELGDCGDYYEVIDLYLEDPNIDFLRLLASSKSTTIGPEELALILKELQGNGSSIQ